ncbi:serine/threonine-protein kinase [Pyxidicoccus caerfyrddinensis]|uniref:serine/threonine-protein kinase n=1 Tax=Pyxidicoccus caerfyrddinensis TaxID=2709663 RepID=UPI001966D6A3|nr:serine/threonine-protein kinase [Pyxidicoccus caerfyrddinensis]
MSSSVTRDIPLGTVLRGTYEIVGVLGRGGMGTVFLANHLRLPGRQVAIKVLRGDGGLGKEVFVRFRREAEIASRLGHPNIVEVLDFDNLEDGSPFLVMECLRGQPLSRRLRRGAPLTLEEVFSIARQMGSALQAAHRAGIVHRDLKPGNVFLMPTEMGGVVVEHVKLLDFGISKVIDSQSINTQGGILLGTPQYMAPEQAQGKNQEVDPRTDIFAFGCMVYEMLARRLPFKDGPLPELIYRIVYDPPQPLASLVPGVPPNVVDAIERALEKKPENRYPDVGSFISELTGSPLQTLPPSAIPVPNLSVRPSQLETVGGRREPPAAKAPPSRAETVSERGPLQSSASVEASAKRPVVNVPLHEVSTMTVEGPPLDGAPPGPEMQVTPPGGATHVVRPDVGVAQGPAPFIETKRSGKRWWVAAAVLVLVGAVGLAVGLRPGITGSKPDAPVARGDAPPGMTTPRPEVAPAGTGVGSVPSQPVSARPEQGGAVPSADPASPAQKEPSPGVAPSQPGPSEPSGTAQVNPEPPGTAQVKPAQPGSELKEPSQGTGPSQPEPSGTAQAEPRQTGPVPSQPMAALPSVDAGTTLSPSGTPGVATPPGASVTARPPTQKPKGTSAPISEAALADLMAAERALARGDSDEALHLVRRSQRVQVTGTSYALLVRTYCLQKDLSNARTTWPRVPAWERTRVRQYCKQYDIAL